MSNLYKWLNADKDRYYTILIQSHLPNEIILNYSWGSCSSKRGGKKNLLVRTEEEVQKYILLMMKRRKSRGYQLIAPTNYSAINTNIFS